MGAHVLEQLKERLDGKVTVLLSTASPYKFTRDVLKALGEAQEGLDDFACMRKLEQLSKQKIPAGLYALMDEIGADRSATRWRSMSSRAPGRS